MTAARFRWGSEAWRREMVAWSEAQVARLGSKVAGPPESVHLRPWSTVVRLSTDTGSLYLKALPARLRHEVPLTRWLGRRFPGRTLPVLASDDDRGFMLLPDGGCRLREAPRDLESWQRLVAGYAEIQLGVAPHVHPLLAFGVPDRTLATLPGAFAALVPGRPRLRLRYERMCAELAEAGIPESIQMDDLHDGNVFVDGAKLRIFDWGDSSISHPFFSLRVALMSAAARLQVQEDALPVRRVRDAYLEPFGRYGSAAKLRRASTLALRTAPTPRADAWRLALGGAGAARAAKWGDPVRALVREQLTMMRSW